MANRFWVGVDQNWHLASNWSATSGGVGGAGIPTAADDVFIDGNGFALCWAASPIVCNDFTILAAATELNLFDQGGIINGDFEMQAGYFGPTGGGGYTMEFKGNYLNSGGSFAVGTGTGVDPTCEFSGTGKTYVHNNSGAASYQNLTFSGSYVLSGTRLSVAYIAQSLQITGDCEISSGNRIDLVGTFDNLSGVLHGAGGFYLRWDTGAAMPNGFSIDLGEFLIDVYDTETFPAGAFEGSENNDVELTYKATGKSFRLGAGTLDIKGKLTLFGDDTILDAELDCATNDAEMTIRGSWFKVKNDQFKECTFVWKMGDGTHNMYCQVQFYFGGSWFGPPTNPDLDVQCGNSTLRLIADKAITYSHRLSLTKLNPWIHDTQTYNIVEFVRAVGDPGAFNFVEGWDADVVIWDCPGMQASGRHPNLIPYGDYHWNEMYALRGRADSKPTLAGRLGFGMGAATKFTIVNKAHVLFLKAWRLDGSDGIKVYDWGGEDLGNVTNWQMGAIPALFRHETFVEGASP